MVVTLQLPSTTKLRLCNAANGKYTVHITYETVSLSLVLHKWKTRAAAKLSAINHIYLSYISECAGSCVVLEYILVGRRANGVFPIYQISDCKMYEVLSSMIS